MPIIFFSLWFSCINWTWHEQLYCWSQTNKMPILKTSRLLLHYMTCYCFQVLHKIRLIHVPFFIKGLNVIYPFSTYSEIFLKNEKIQLSRCDWVTASNSKTSQFYPQQISCRLDVSKPVQQLILNTFQRTPSHNGMNQVQDAAVLETNMKALEKVFFLLVKLQLLRNREVLNFWSPINNFCDRLGIIAIQFWSEIKKKMLLLESTVDI